MRVRGFVVSCLLPLVGCASPLAAALPLVAQQAGFPREAFAVPTEDGTVFVTVSGGPTTSRQRLNREWVQEATKACQGEYLLLSNSTARRRRGAVSSEIQEGFVRCVSPEAFEELRERVAPTTQNRDPAASS